MKRALLLGLVTVALSLPAWALLPPAIVPRTPTGASGIEQRYVYAPPDEGRFDIPLRLGLSAPNEVQLEEPSMCNGGSGHVSFQYSKRQNKVIMEADFKGLPYRMSYTRPEDVSTPYNRFPVSVSHGKWQLWIGGRVFTFSTHFYYDSATLRLLGHERDFPGGPPPGSFTVTLPTVQLLGTPLFEGTPEGNAHVRFEFAYDRLLDDIGGGGSYFVYIPPLLCKPDEVIPWYLNGGLPAADAMSWDQVLETIWKGGSIGISLSLEPDPKPSYLAARDNTMTSWGSFYPQVYPDGLDIDFFTGTYLTRTSCATRINPPPPRAYYNLCGGN
jgi:hypothetical protein